MEQTNVVNIKIETKSAREFLYQGRELGPSMDRSVIKCFKHLLFFGTKVYGI